MTISAPCVSVVMAAYNRSNVLALAIRSLLAQTIEDWELWVIGDACTDDSEAVVAAFKDSRIHFHNLSENVGEQSGPNNEGIRRAGGRYIAFLNQDDLWLPDHLEACLATIEGTNADVACSLMEVILPDSSMNFAEGCLTADGYSPHIEARASTWLVRHEMFALVGPWRSAWDIHGTPSQDWLFRAWRAGRRIVSVPRLTVLAAQSSAWKDSYRDRHDSPQRGLFERMQEETDFRERELTTLLLNYARRDWDLGLAWRLRRMTTILLARLAMIFGLSPRALRNVIIHRRKGRLIERFRKMRGLPPLPRR